jgi:hypothetical protein
MENIEKIFDKKSLKNSKKILINRQTTRSATFGIESEFFCQTLMKFFDKKYEKF